VTTNEALEQRLRSMFDFPVTDGIRAKIDERAAAVVGRPASVRRSRPLRLRRAVLLAVAATMLIGAGTIASTLFGQLLFTPGWQTAWDRSVSIGLEQAVDGNAIRLERGYADSTMVLLGWQGSLPSGEPGVEAMGRLTDAAGREYRPGDGAGTDEVPGGITLATFEPLQPLPDGGTEFTLSFGDTATFTFTLPVHGGTQLAIGATSSASNFAITLDEFRTSPTNLLSYVSLERLPGAPSGEAWAPIGHLEFNGRRISLSSMRDDETGHLVISAVEGVDDPAGHWRLVFDELVGHNGQWPDNQQIRISGSWVFEFDVPSP
jgi:hypothetical protein